MSLKSWFISKTNREGLLYGFVDNCIFRIQKWINWIARGHFLRASQIRNYMKTHDKRKLNVGCGHTHFKNYLNTDIFGKVPIDITKKLPFGKESFDVIYSNHVAEHIYMRQLKFFFKESFRVMKKGGIQIVQTPSLEKISKIMYCSNSKDSDYILKSHKELQQKNVTKALYINDVSHICFGHKYLYDFELINELAKEAGYKKVIKISNNALPDKDIKIPKDKFWDLTTETFVLYK